MLAACLFALLTGLTSCGGNGEEPITEKDYQAICEGYQQCYPQERFEGFFG